MVSSTNRHLDSHRPDAKFSGSQASNWKKKVLSKVRGRTVGGVRHAVLFVEPNGAVVRGCVLKGATRVVFLDVLVWVLSICIYVRITRTYILHIYIHIYLCITTRSLWFDLVG